MAEFSTLARKKIVGVPAIYWAGAAAIALAIVAYKMKASPDATTDDTAGNQPTDGAAPTANPYDSLNPDGNGTVTVQQLGPNTSADTADTVKTNDDWVREGVVWLIANKHITGTVANAALTKYVNGQDRSFDEDDYVNAWYAQDGPPPEGVAEGGNVAPATAARQITTLPGYHTVKGTTDNSWHQLTKLYYGSDTQQNIDLLQAGNTGLPPAAEWPVGTKVYIPAYTAPGYYITPTAMTSAQIGAKNGITPAQIVALNNVTYTNWRKGAKVRVK